MSIRVLCFAVVLVARLRPTVLASEAAKTAEVYLSDEFFPGLHILEWADSGLRIFPRGQRPKGRMQDGTIFLKDAKDWGTMKDARRSLRMALKIPKEEPLQTRWALFDAQGHRLNNLTAMTQSPVIFLLQMGQWMWPAVRVGFEHKVHGVFNDKLAILRTLSLRPVIFEVQNFFSVEETEKVMAIGRKQGLTASMGILQSADIAKGTKHSDFRTSKQTFLDNRLSPLIAELDDRVARLTRIPTSHNEPAQLLRYDEGNYYHGHMDWSELELVADQKVHWMNHHMGWQDRLGNVFWYLNDVENGGHTIFPKHGQPICEPDSMGGPGTRTCNGAEDPVMSSCEQGLKVHPKRGSVILWYNYHPNGRGDRNSLHAGCPPGKNITKWSANKWFQIKPRHVAPEWIDGHPAIERFGFQSGAKVVNPNECLILFANNAAEAANLMWEGSDGMKKIVSIPPGGSTSQNSWKGHRFALWSGSRKSNVIVCKASGEEFTLSSEFKLRLEGGGTQREEL